MGDDKRERERETDPTMDEIGEPVAEGGAAASREGRKRREQRKDEVEQDKMVMKEE